MATRKPTPEEAHEERVTEDLTDEDTWEFPSSSPDKKILTAKALLESGLVGIWKDRTDIGDSVAYARKLRRQANKRNQV
ncbi:MAG: hypothetical protein ACYDAR_13650 [Thermomicrobiales bacterium]